MATDSFDDLQIFEWNINYDIIYITERRCTDSLHFLVVHEPLDAWIRVGMLGLTLDGNIAILGN